MKRISTLEVVFFQDPTTKNEPVREWIKAFDLEDRKIIGHDLWFLQTNWPIGKPYVDSLVKGLLELRITLSNRIVRIIFIIKKDKIIALHAFIKKTQKTPLKEIEIALKRIKMIEY